MRVTSTASRGELHALVEQERRLTAQALGEREDASMRLKVEGLLYAAELWVLALAEGREARRAVVHWTSPCLLRRAHVATGTLGQARSARLAAI